MTTDASVTMLSKIPTIETWNPESQAPRKVFCNAQCSRRKIMVLACAVIAFLAAVVSIPVVVTAKADHYHQQQPLRIGAFNIRRFGKSKISNDTIAHAIGSILQRYDVVLILEVVDVSQTSIADLLKILRTTDKSWRYISSSRLGRSRYKEQYLFYYKSTSVSVEGKYQVPDTEDVFEREPYAIKVNYKSASSGKTGRVALAGIHIKPTEAVAELEALPVSIKQIANSFSNIDGVILMGDYNAACNYLSQKQQQSLGIFSSNAYRNLISHTMDTTLGKGDCAYDRVTVYGSKIDVRNAQVYRFDEDLKMSMTDALAISDHYPVEFLLY